MFIFSHCPCLKHTENCECCKLRVPLGERLKRNIFYEELGKPAVIINSIDAAHQVYSPMLTYIYSTEAEQTKPVLYQKYYFFYIIYTPAYILSSLSLPKAGFNHTSRKNIQRCVPEKAIYKIVIKPHCKQSETLFITNLLF